MDIEATIKSQYYAALKMLETVITVCPDELWDHPGQVNRFWHTAFHALFYMHLYLQPREAGFNPWEKHEEQFISLEGGAIPEGQANSLRGPYQKEELLDYLNFCWGEVERQIDGIDLGAESGFYWLPFDKFELQFYNIRHIQHHTGELYHCLEGQKGVDLKWVGRMEGV